MCRNIKTLHNFDPPATRDEIRASSLQFVRKLCGFTEPSHANEAAFNRAVEDVTHVAQHLLDSLVTNAPPRDREVQRMKARARSEKRVAQATAPLSARTTITKPVPNQQVSLAVVVLVRADVRRETLPGE